MTASVPLLNSWLFYQTEEACSDWVTKHGKPSCESLGAVKALTLLVTTCHPTTGVLIFAGGDERSQAFQELAGFGDYCVRKFARLVAISMLSAWCLSDVITCGVSMRNCRLINI